MCFTIVTDLSVFEQNLIKFVFYLYDYFITQKSIIKQKQKSLKGEQNLNQHLNQTKN